MITNYVGLVASAWRLPILEDQPPHSTVSAWLLQAPQAHRLWVWHFMSVIHLRPVEGLKAAEIEVEGATHELILLALDPKKCPPNWDPTPILLGRVPRWSPPWMTPPDLWVQFHAFDDAAAVALADQVARAVAAGVLVPDSDHRTRWETVVTASARHALEGHGRAGDA